MVHRRYGVAELGLPRVADALLNGNELRLLTIRSHRLAEGCTFTTWQEAYALACVLEDRGLMIICPNVANTDLLRMIQQSAERGRPADEWPFVEGAIERYRE